MVPQDGAEVGRAVAAEGRKVVHDPIRAPLSDVGLQDVPLANHPDNRIRNMLAS